MNNKVIVLVLVLMFALALGAGVVAGKLSSRLPGGTSEGEVTRGTLSQELQLTEQQRQQMKQIWEPVRDMSTECIAAAKKVQHDQDEALMKILTEEQRVEYQKLTERTAAQIGVLDGKRKAAVKDAIKRTEAILNESQRRSYKSLINDQLGDFPEEVGRGPAQIRESL